MSIIINYMLNIYNNFISSVHWICFGYSKPNVFYFSDHLEWHSAIWSHHHSITFNIVYL